MRSVAAADWCKRVAPALAMKYGFASVEEYKEKVQKKFSLLETGIIQKPSTRLLLVNVGSLPVLVYCVCL